MNEKKSIKRSLGLSQMGFNFGKNLRSAFKSKDLKQVKSEFGVENDDS